MDQALREVPGVWRGLDEALRISLPLWRGLDEASARSSGYPQPVASGHLEERMGAEGEKLAAQFTQAYNAVAEYIESLDEVTWARVVEGEGATVGAVMHHVAQSTRYNGSVLKAFREGNEPVALTQASIDAFNATEKADSQAEGPSRADVLAALRSGAERNATSMAALPDEVFSKPVRILVGDHTAESLRDWLETIVIPHGPSHVDSCREGATSAS